MAVPQLCVIKPFATKLCKGFTLTSKTSFTPTFLISLIVSQTNGFFKPSVASFNHLLNIGRLFTLILLKDFVHNISSTFLFGRCNIFEIFSVVRPLSFNLKILSYCFIFLSFNFSFNSRYSCTLLAMFSRSFEYRYPTNLQKSRRFSLEAEKIALIFTDLLPSFLVNIGLNLIFCILTLNFSRSLEICLTKLCPFLTNFSSLLRENRNASNFLL